LNYVSIYAREREGESVRERGREGGIKQDLVDSIALAALEVHAVGRQLNVELHTAV
jgi:hypothetical protein